MRSRGTVRTVFSTESGRVCPRCGWPEKNCTCSRVFEEAVPDRIVARLRIEKAGRRGKTVTVEVVHDPHPSRDGLTGDIDEWDLDAFVSLSPSDAGEEAPEYPAGRET